MLIPRVIPCLLIRETSLVKTTRFKNPQYIGDPINAVHIFNDMEVDEIVILDISATHKGRKPDFKMIENLAGECFMPLSYGGGIRSLEDARAILKIGVEKIILNTVAFENPEFIRLAAKEFGSQSVLVSVDVKKVFLGKYQVFVKGGRKGIGKDPVEYSKQMQDLGVGEIILTSIDRDGTWEGYDIDLIKQVASAVSVPVVACGGAGCMADFSEAVKIGGASAAAAGSVFVYQGKDLGVLINYPVRDEIEKVFLQMEGTAH